MSKYSKVIELRGKHNADRYVHAGWELIKIYAGLAPLGRGQTTLTYRLGWRGGEREPVRPEIDEHELEPGPSAN
jgi:hypothetical protein